MVGLPVFYPLVILCRRLDLSRSWRDVLMRALTRNASNDFVDFFTSKSLPTESGETEERRRDEL